MVKNSGNFSMEDAKALENTPAGQQLMALLRQADPSALRAALAQAQKGDAQGAKKALAPLLSSRELQDLLKQLGG